MSKTRRGLRLAGVSWKVVVADPVILVVLLVGVVGSLVLSAAMFLLLYRRFPEASDLRFPGYLVALPILWVGNVVSSYCNVVVTVDVATDHQLRIGENVCPVSEIFDRARPLQVGLPGNDERAALRPSRRRPGRWAGKDHQPRNCRAQQNQRPTNHRCSPKP